jgi:hypothetical protein
MPAFRFDNHVTEVSHALGHAGIVGICIARVNRNFLDIIRTVNATWTDCRSDDILLGSIESTNGAMTTQHKHSCAPFIMDRDIPLRQRMKNELTASSRIWTSGLCIAMDFSLTIRRDFRIAVDCLFFLSRLLEGPQFRT